MKCVLTLIKFRRLKSTMTMVCWMLLKKHSSNAWPAQKNSLSNSMKSCKSLMWIEKLTTNQHIPLRVKGRWLKNSLRLRTILLQVILSKHKKIYFSNIKRSLVKWSRFPMSTRFFKRWLRPKRNNWEFWRRKLSKKIIQSHRWKEFHRCVFMLVLVLLVWHSLEEHHWLALLLFQLLQ